ncbi:GrpE-domain-containing protein [Cokeromyces recurvatus]|uniref:GrpE-domain-containing protein n=1 Tax=Cokeromyces recurvatus TaxID=90255 RepID=UPI002220603F|nr:GrpE-domain-containing protein [Cokeromyces recurvatus]KAI7903078.1 GrpE-domain-containing protein [Cokeromyces recurvatus]
MLPISSLRNAATMSVRRTAVMRIVKPSIPLTIHRTFATENNGKEENSKEGEANNTDGENTPKIELTEEAKKLLAEKDKQLAEIKDAYLRCLADQENIRERSRKEIETTKEYAIQKFAKDLLDTVDILNMALIAVPTELRSKETSVKSEIATDAGKILDQLTNLYTGLSMTESELIKALKRHGVERENPEGQLFDPNKHQALFQAPVPNKEAGTIFVVQKMGYTLKGRVLRPAQVGVVAESS